MLTDLESQLERGDARDLLNRLDGRDTNAALAGELELGLLWALSKITATEFHVTLPNGRRPDARCPDLFLNAPTFIEITAISDDTFSDRDKMDRAARIISACANRTQRKAGDHLHFQYNEQSGYKKGRYYRRRVISSDFILTADVERQLSDWLISGNPKTNPLRITTEKIDVLISWQAFVHPEGRTFSTMPAIAYDLEENPIYRRLDEKRSQLSGIPRNARKCIFLADAGSSTLRDLTPVGLGANAVSGKKIIQHFLSRHPDVDFVAIFSPSRDFLTRSPTHWRVTCFDTKNSTTEAIEKATKAGEYDILNKVAKALPRPHYEAYQARSLHRQGLFSPQSRGQYLGVEITTRGHLMPATVKVSARLVLELLSGRLTLDQFKHFGGSEHLSSLLGQGRTIQEARIEKKGVDEDDDHLVLELDYDPAALPLTIKESEPPADDPSATTSS